MNARHEEVKRGRPGMIPFLATFLRSFTLQASWNLERMQNLGFAFSLLPSLRRMKGDGNALNHGIRRYLSFFNTHPYMSALFLGAVLQMEGEGVEGEEIDSFRSGLLGSCAAIGDSLFWATLRPILVMFATFLTLVSFPSPLLMLLPPLLLTFLYNILHLSVRYRCFRLGISEGRGAVSCLRELNFPALTIRMRRFLAPVAGILGAGVFFFLFRGLEWAPDTLLLLPSILFTGIFLLLIRKGIPVVVIIYITFGLLLLISGLTGSLKG